LAFLIFTFFWAKLEESNASSSSRTDLYDLIFLDSDFGSELLRIFNP